MSEFMAKIPDDITLTLTLHQTKFPEETPGTTYNHMDGA